MSHSRFRLDSFHYKYFARTNTSFNWKREKHSVTVTLRLKTYYARGFNLSRASIALTFEFEFWESERLAIRESNLVFAL